MSTLKKYAETAEKVIGKRSVAKIEYDNEVLRWMHITRDIRSSVEKANLKFPQQASGTGGEELASLRAYYDYLAVHGEIVRNLKLQLAQKK